MSTLVHIQDANTEEKFVCECPEEGYQVVLLPDSRGRRAPHLFPDTGGTIMPLRYHVDDDTWRFS